MSTKGKVKKPKAQVSSDFLSSSNDPFMFDIDPKLKAELDNKGLATRWINRTKYVDNRGDHRGWRPYKLEGAKVEQKDALDFQYGVDPDGYVSRGDLVLAVRPMEVHEANRRRIARKNQAQQGHQAQAARELQEQTGMKVHQGYDDEVRGYRTRGEENIGDDE
jgi:hypothetical protein